MLLSLLSAMSPFLLEARRDSVNFAKWHKLQILRTKYTILCSLTHEIYILGKCDCCRTRVVQWTIFSSQSIAMFKYITLIGFLKVMCRVGKFDIAFLIMVAFPEIKVPSFSRVLKLFPVQIEDKMLFPNICIGMNAKNLNANIRHFLVNGTG